jgi:hypothetical protein
MDGREYMNTTAFCSVLDLTCSAIDSRGAYGSVLCPRDTEIIQVSFRVIHPEGGNNSDYEEWLLVGYKT